MRRPNPISRKGLMFGLQVPATALIAFGIMVPLASGFSAALRHDGSWSLANYRTVLTELPYVPIVLNTFLVSALVCVFSVGFAFVVCLQFARAGRLATRFFLGALTVIIAISLLVKNYALQVILAYNGPVNDLGLFLGLFDSRQYLLYTKTAVVIAMVQFLTPYAALILFGAMRRIDFDIVLAARTLGAGGWTTFRTALWPQVSSSVLMAGILVFSISAGFFVTPALLGGPEDAMIGSQMHTDLIYNHEHGAGLAAAQGIVLTLALAAVAFVAVAIAGSGFLNAADDASEGGI